MLVVPIVIFQTQSLVSIELSSSSGNSLELPDDCEIINLPNLKKLSLQFVSFRTNFTESNSIVIKAPKLEYLDISAPKPGIFSFEEEPIALREAKIKFTNDVGALSDKENGLMSEFYGAVSNVRFLTLNISKVGNLSLVFRYATRLTFDMNVSQSLKTMSSLLEMCPVLDAWTVDVLDKGKDNEETLLRALKRIHIDIWIWNYTCEKPAESFLDLIAYLLRNAPNLEQYN
ncbi:putative F-box/FBD/LRR-repeat protein At1g78760 [Silene latifolia]|uniref:putative F-box/FBD/LRR-repeat protein At1g78760 n=1 Tax=Silene latifolia TaxID=37657 RepID=UPI003D77B755